ncbi:hypothetical protein AB0J74_38725 [Asanoa sp. NPDC049573]
MMLPLWEEVLPRASDEAVSDAKRRIADSLGNEGPVRGASVVRGPTTPL